MQPPKHDFMNTCYKSERYPITFINEEQVGGIVCPSRMFGKYTFEVVNNSMRVNHYPKFGLNDIAYVEFIEDGTSYKDVKEAIRDAGRAASFSSIFGMCGWIINAMYSDRKMVFEMYFRVYLKEKILDNRVFEFWTFDQNLIKFLLEKLRKQEDEEQQQNNRAYSERKANELFGD
jgi:hypothetical protein